MKGSRVVAVALVMAVIAFIGYLLSRERRIATQRANGYDVSGNPSNAPLHSLTVFSVGDLFLTYDSTDLNSALWVGYPSGGLLSMLWPEANRPLDFESLVKWNDSGRVVWSKMGRTSVELLVEFAPETNHRIALLRATCVENRCRSTAQERGIPPDERLSVGNDGSALLVNDKTLTWYDSVAELLSGSESKATARLTPSEPNEIVGTAREAAMVLANRDSLSGEILEDKLHDPIAFTLSANAGTPSAVSINDGIQFVTDAAGQTRFWDCPWSVLKGDAECTVYLAPSGFPASGLLAVHETECGLTMSRGDRIWLLRRTAKTQELMSASGIVNCANGELMTYRKRKIEYQSPQRQPVTSELRRVSPHSK